MAKHYTIDESKKIIYADILKLTEKEMNEVERFRRMGYSVENKTPNKAEVKRLNDEFILEFLADDEQALNTYKGLKNEIATDEDGNKKTTSTGKDKKKGFNAGRNWFAKNYDPKGVDIDVEIQKAGLKKDFDEAWEEYSEKHANDTDKTKVMNAIEYKRDFYWKKIFVNPIKPKKK